MNNPFKIITSEVRYQNPWMSLREDKVIRPWWKEGIFWVVNMKDGVTIIAIDTDNYIYLTKEYAYAQWDDSIEAISGWLEGDEDILQCAKRETAEETGLIANQWTYLWFIDPFTSVIKSRNYIYLAQELSQGRDHPDEGEIITTIKIPFQEALQMIYDGKISHAASVVWMLRAKDILKI